MSKFLLAAHEETHSVDGSPRVPFRPPANLSPVSHYYRKNGLAPERAVTNKLLVFLCFAGVVGFPAYSAKLPQSCLQLMALVAEHPQNFDIVASLGQQFTNDSDAVPPLHRLAEIIAARSEALRTARSPEGEVAISETESRLVLRYAPSILETIVPRNLASFAKFQIREGYVSQVEMTLADFVKRGSEVFSAFPIRHLQITSRFPRPGKGLWESFFASPLLAQLDSLTTEGIEIGKRVEHLIRSPYLRNLRRLRISNGFNILQRSSFERFIRESDFPNLQALDLTGNSAVKSESLHLFAEAQNFPALRHLDLSGNSMYSLNLRKISDGRFYQSLFSLRMARCSIEWIKLPRVVGFFNNLRVLDLSGNSIRVEDGRELLLQDFVQRLDHLELRGSGLEITELWPHVERISRRANTTNSR